MHYSNLKIFLSREDKVELTLNITFLPIIFSHLLPQNLHNPLAIMSLTSFLDIEVEVLYLEFIFFEVGIDGED